MAAVCSCGNGSNKTAQEKAAALEQVKADSIALAQEAQKNADALANMPEEPIFNIITNYGEIKIYLYSGTPKHRDNFTKLALSGFYNGILFHRVINGFMIQAGDPFSKDESQKDKWGTGGPGYTVPAEFVPEYRHKKGAIAAARRGDAANPLKESSGSQFYLVQNEAACAQLDGQYTVFGETISGLDVVDKIANVATGPRDCPLSPVQIISIKLEQE